MIKHNNKKCTIEDCDKPLFARGFCVYHYRTKFLAPKVKLKITNKKARINTNYLKNRELFIKNLRNKDKNHEVYCIFCGQKINGEPSLHHVFGRDDSVMMNEKYWFLSHNWCHVGDYHSKSWKDIKWWDIYLKNIEQYPEILEKELRRMNK